MKDGYLAEELAGEDWQKTNRSSLMLFNSCNLQAIVDVVVVVFCCKCVSLPLGLIIMGLRRPFSAHCAHYGPQETLFGPLGSLSAYEQVVTSHTSGGENREKKSTRDKCVISKRSAQELSPRDMKGTIIIFLRPIQPPSNRTDLQPPITEKGDQSPFSLFPMSLCWFSSAVVADTFDCLFFKKKINEKKISGSCSR